MKRKSVVLLDIARAVRSCCGVTLSQLRSDSRQVPLLYVRQAFCRLAMKHTTRSLPAIGNYLQRDHSTVYSALEAKTEPAESRIRAVMQAVEAKLPEVMGLDAGDCLVFRKDARVWKITRSKKKRLFVLPLMKCGRTIHRTSSPGRQQTKLSCAA